MSNIAAVELWLLDSTYKLGCPVERQQELKDAGDLLEQRFREFRMANPRMDNQKIAVMVGLQLMQEILVLNKTLQQYQQSELTLTDIVDALDKHIKTLDP